MKNETVGCLDMKHEIYLYILPANQITKENIMWLLLLISILFMGSYILTLLRSLVPGVQRVVGGIII